MRVKSRKTETERELICFEELAKLEADNVGWCQQGTDQLMVNQIKYKDAERDQRLKLS